MMRRFAPLIPVLLLSVSCGDDVDRGPALPVSPSVGLDEPFRIEELTVGTGPGAVNGNTLSVNYTGWLYDPNAAENKGARFDSGNFSFVLGAGRVISGWDRGMLGMRVGGFRRIVVPPELGYGDGGRPPVIPGDATLLFEVNLLSIG